MSESTISAIDENATQKPHHAAKIIKNGLGENRTAYVIGVKAESNVPRDTDELR
jgi:hypothetical protein